LHPDITRASVLIAERYEKSASIGASGKKDVLSTSEVTLTESISHDFDAPSENKPKQYKTWQDAAERTDGSSKAIQPSSWPMAGQSDPLISTATDSALQNGERPQDIPVDGAGLPRSINSPLRFGRPVLHTGDVVLENTEVMKAGTEASGKEIGVKFTMRPTLQMGEQVDVKLQPLSKPQTDTQTTYQDVASPKTQLSGDESMLDPEEAKVQKAITDPTTALKEVVTKKVTLEQKPQGIETEKNHFELPYPRLKRTPIYNDAPSKPQTVNDFSFRAADALISLRQSQTSKKNSGSTSAGPFAAINVESGMPQQNYSVISNHNVGAQTQSGSERLEKWIDTQLDLTSRGWVNNLSKTLVSAINRGQQRLMLALSPPSLGRINIVFNAKSAGLDLRIHAERKATLSLLGDAETKLVSNMENAGHKVNNLSYAEMSSSENNFDFDHYQSANGGKDDADERDLSEREDINDIVQVAQDKSVAKNIDDASLVNITV